MTCRAVDCARSTTRRGNPDRFALCPDCTARVLAGRVVTRRDARLGARVSGASPRSNDLGSLPAAVAATAGARPG